MYIIAKQLRNLIVIDFVIVKHIIRILIWIVRCTVWSISHVNTGMEQSEIFSIGSLIFPHVSNHNASCVSACICYFTESYLVLQLLMWRYLVIKSK